MKPAPIDARALLGLDDLARLPAYFRARIRPQAFGCWEWTGSYTQSNDRPKCGVAHGQAGETLAHRAVAVLLGGPAPADRPIARHVCHNRHCVRFGPGHVQWGTAAENLADRTTYGEWATGERNGRARLTRADVAALRSGAQTPAALAAARGLNAKHLTQVAAGRYWQGV